MNDLLTTLAWLIRCVIGGHIEMVETLVELWKRHQWRKSPTVPTHQEHHDAIHTGGNKPISAPLIQRMAQRVVIEGGLVITWEMIEDLGGQRFLRALIARIEEIQPASWGICTWGNHTVHIELTPRKIGLAP